MEFNPVFSVSEFNEMINRHLGLLDEFEVEGEISSLRISQNKWINIIIKDDNSSVDVFGMTFQIQNFNSLAEGMLVKISGSAKLYKKTGRFSIQAKQILPSGEGALKLAFEKLKKKLADEGLFDESRKRELPMFPQTVGLLTAKDSEAYNDFIKVTNERIGGVKIYFYPVNVQGVNTVESVKSGISYFNLKKHVDVIVITRGGGSPEDLIVFNEEQIVRAVYASKTPTVCAIGHEGDVTLIELAADLRASTPSNASELLFRDRTEIFSQIRHYMNYIEERLQSKIAEVSLNTNHWLVLLESRLESSIACITFTVKQFYKYIEACFQKINTINNDVMNSKVRLHNSMLNLMKMSAERIQYLEEKLLVLDPKSILKRGYSILKDKTGAIISSVDHIKTQDTIDATLIDGTIHTVVLNTLRGEL